MPAGIPVATMAIGKAGARNAGIFAVQLLALSDSVLSEKLSAYKEELAAGVAVRAEALQERLSKEKF
jgi:phosphoribosylcarboxyaminoimidazole (NCAIR) mutase